MASGDEIAPSVQSILTAARERSTTKERVHVQARSVQAALADVATQGRRPVIAEVKPTSPTTAATRTIDPVTAAEAMVAGGAAAISVLTEPEHFGGDPDMLRRIRAAVDVPVLRKDFILDEAQLDTVRADAVLLIARFLDDLEEMAAAARSRGFEVLVETHTAAEFRAAISAGADLIGINNRDLARLEVDLATFDRVLSTVAVPEQTTVIAESGITNPDDADRMLAAGADGLLIGSAIMDTAPATITTNTKTLVTDGSPPSA